MNKEERDKADNDHILIKNESRENFLYFLRVNIHL